MIVLRKVRNGRVKIGKKWFSPREDYAKYDGRFDGLVMAFGRYKDYYAKGINYDYAPFVSLWGDENMFKAEDEEEFSEACDNSIIWSTITNDVGWELKVLHWEWWDEVKEEPDDNQGS